MIADWLIYLANWIVYTRQRIHVHIRGRTNQVASQLPMATGIIEGRTLLELVPRTCRAWSMFSRLCGTVFLYRVLIGSIDDAYRDPANC